MESKRENMDIMLALGEEELQNLSQDLKEIRDLGEILTTLHDDQAQLNICKVQIARMDGMWDKFCTVFRNTKEYAKLINVDTPSLDTLRQTTKAYWFEALSFQESLFRRSRQIPFLHTRTNSTMYARKGQVRMVKVQNKHYDSDDEDLSCGHWCEYVLVVILSSVLLVASLVLVLFWCLYYRKGYAWNENPKVQFNLHPTLMVAGFIFFSGFSMLLYRISRCCRRIYVKLLHTVFHALAIPCVVLGFMAVLDSHNLADPPVPNFYSIHSWMGFVTMGLFALQFVVGFFSFLLLMCCDSSTANFRASLVPIHATFGLTTFVLAVATCLTGLSEEAYLNFGINYTLWPEEGIIMNALAMVLVALAILVSYAVRREPLRVNSTCYVSERL
ncbi:cytochrome b reductase 1 isoform X2 [Cimex lectularius]|uniref:Cytochrome b561 domain-containing protein n=1 Tax=Cimex lectularius TaxID=79782 RepID=A0A8I6SS37_CIMLE|nr:cytochrome b reductase 1 isoform X2 [Cimex lectularius]